MIYFDNAATTKPSECCVKAVNDALVNFGNPSSLHRVGLDAAMLVSAARRVIADSIGAEEDEIFFTSGATEASNTAIFGAARSVGKRKNKIVISSVEHPSVDAPCKMLESEGFDLVRVSPRADGFHAEDFLAAVDDNTCLVSCMFCNNETGELLPVERIFRRIKKKFPRVLTHCDLVQGYMKFSVRAKKLGADMISISGHKVHAPKGIGALYIKKGVHIPSLVLGGGQERGFRSGTESVPLISGFGATVGQLSGNIDERYEKAAALSAYLRSECSKLDGVVFNSSPDSSPYVNSIAVCGLRSEIVLHFLESRGIYVSSGSACSKGKKSSVLTEFGIPDELADSTLRISFCADNTTDEIDALIEALKDAKTTILTAN